MSSHCSSLRTVSQPPFYLLLHTWHISIGKQKKKIRCTPPEAILAFWLHPNVATTRSWCNILRNDILHRSPLDKDPRHVISTTRQVLKLLSCTNRDLVATFVSILVFFYRNVYKSFHAMLAPRGIVNAPPIASQNNILSVLAKAPLTLSHCMTLMPEQFTRSSR